MSFKLFVTGTDTGIGKTHVSVGLLKAFNQKNYTTIGLKPLASGSDYADGKLLNADALALQQAASVKLDYDLVNPLAYELAITPHLAAAHVSQSLDRDHIIAKLQISLAQPADVHIIEGILFLGHTLEPTICTGESILINTNKEARTSVVNDEIYVIRTPEGDTMTNRCKQGPLFVSFYDKGGRHAQDSTGRQPVPAALAPLRSRHRRWLVVQP